MANYPSSASSDTNLYIQVNNKTTNLTANISNSDTTIPVTSTTGFPSSGTVTIDLEIVSYTSIDATNFLGATRGFDGTTAVAHLSGALVSHNIIAAHHNVVKDEIIATQTDLVAVQSSLSDLAPANTSTSILTRIRQIVTQLKNITGLANWYDTFTFFPISKGGTNSGTALNNNRIIRSSSGAIIEAAAITSNRALASDANGIPTHTAVTDTELGYVSGVTSAIQTQLNAKATDANVVHLTGNESIAGTKTFTDPIVQNDTTNQIVLGVTNTTTLSATAPSTSRTVTIPDLSANYSIVGTAGTQTISGTKTFDGQLIGKGTVTNDSAASGYIGEYIESTSTANTAAFTSGNYGDYLSISLTAGDWDVTGLIYNSQEGATWSTTFGGITATAGNDSTGFLIGVNADAQSWASSSTTPVIVTLTIPSVRVSVSSTTTYYLKSRIVYSAGAPLLRGGRISARRAR